MSAWIEKLIAVNAEIIDCERRLGRQCTRVVTMMTIGKDTTREEMLLAPYGASLTLMRIHRDPLLQDAGRYT